VSAGPRQDLDPKPRHRSQSVAWRTDVATDVINETHPAPDAETDFLMGSEAIPDFVNAAFADGDLRVLLRALRQAVNSRGGLAWLESEVDLPSDVVYRTVVEYGNPGLSSFLAVLKALGLSLAVRQRQGAS